MKNDAEKRFKLIHIFPFQLPKLKFRWDTRAGPMVFVSYGKINLGLALLCHRKEERCLSFCGHKSLLCARCTGICSGLLASFLLYLYGVVLNVYVHPVFAFALVLPMAIDGFSQLFGARESTNSIRLITGFLFSLGIFSILVR